MSKALFGVTKTEQENIIIIIIIKGANLVKI